MEACNTKQLGLHCYIELNYIISLVISVFKPEAFSALPSSQGAQESTTPSLADLRMDSGSGMECRTMAPYRPYSAMTLLRPQHFSRFLHLARRFWNHTLRGRHDWLMRTQWSMVTLPGSEVRIPNGWGHATHVNRIMTLEGGTMAEGSGFDSPCPQCTRIVIHPRCLHPIPSSPFRTRT